MKGAGAVLAAVLTALSLGAAKAEDWTVSSMKGSVKVSANGEWRALRPGQVVRHGAWLKTSTNGSVELSRDGTRVSVKPRTLIAVAGLEGDPDMTVIVQRWGGTSLDVEKRERPHVKVHTPFLSAVVKGTKFDTDVGRYGTSTSVSEGIVDVTDGARGSSATVGANQRATAATGRLGGLKTDGPGAKAVVNGATPVPASVRPIGDRAIVTPDNVNDGPTVRPNSGGWALREDTVNESNWDSLGARTSTPASRVQRSTTNGTPNTDSGSSSDDFGSDSSSSDSSSSSGGSSGGSSSGGSSGGGLQGGSGSPGSGDSNNE